MKKWMASAVNCLLYLAWMAFVVLTSMLLFWGKYIVITHDPLPETGISADIPKKPRVRTIDDMKDRETLCSEAFVTIDNEGNTWLRRDNEVYPCTFTWPRDMIVTKYAESWQKRDGVTVLWPKLDRVVVKHARFYHTDAVIFDQPYDSWIPVTVVK